MSVKPYGTIEPSVAWVGTSPDHEGIVTLFDPGSKDRLTVIISASAAVAWGQQLQRAGEAELKRLTEKLPRMPRQSPSPLLSREAFKRLDS